MASAFASSSAEIGFARAGMLGAHAPQTPAGGAARARATAEEFEAVFVNTMFQQMFTGIDGEGPFGGSKGAGVWRSFLSDEYAKSFVKSGGLGISDTIYRELLAQQESSNGAAGAPLAGAAPRATR